MSEPMTANGLVTQVERRSPGSLVGMTTPLARMEVENATYTRASDNPSDTSSAPCSEVTS